MRWDLRYKQKVEGALVVNQEAGKGRGLAEASESEDEVEGPEDKPI